MLPYTKQERKARPMFRGLLQYFPDALSYVAHVSHVGNEQHNAGQPMHWAREKSSDHGDCIIRHQCDAGTVDDDKLLHSGKVAWRALAQLQLELEQRAEESVPVADSATSFRSLISAGRLVNSVQLLNYYEDTLYRSTAKPRVYVAGPMRGVKDFNFPAFDQAARFFRQNGWDVTNPADLDRAAPNGVARSDEEASSEERVTEYMQRDLADNLLKYRASNGDAIALLPGWEKSRGAVAEFAVARWAGLRILDATTGEPLTDFMVSDLVNLFTESLRGANGK